MPKPASRANEIARRRQRYAILRTLLPGIKSVEAGWCSWGPTVFRRRLVEAGIDPDLYPQLSTRLPGGPRLERELSPGDAFRRERRHRIYAYARSMGIPARAACRLSNAPSTFARVMLERHTGPHPLWVQEMMR